MKTNSQRIVVVGATLTLIGVLSACSLVPDRPARALPIFTRRYGTPCQTCHLIPPKLNKMGLAFQANHFQWPGQKPPAFHNDLGAIPISALTTNVVTQGQNVNTLTAFQTQELFAANSFKLNHYGNGGYWLDYFAATNNNQRASDLDGAWVSVPVAGDKGELKVTGGQIAPLSYQWDQISNLSQVTPAPFGNGFDNLTFSSSQPTVRLEYFDKRGQRTANGDYIDLGVPFDGHITLNRDSQWDGPHGVYLQAFKRVGYTTAGVFCYTRDDNHYGCLIGTRHVGHYFYLMGVAAIGHDTNGEQRYLSGQVDACPYPWLALSGRYESITGSSSDAYPIVTATVYPAKMYWLRVTGEAVMQRANRSNTVYVFVQL
jgi:hypothetical protein